MKIDSLRNASIDSQQISLSPFIQLGYLGEIRDTIIDPPTAINNMSVVTRCVIGKYFGMGLFSYMANTEVGRYCAVASRCSIGAFSHPTNWLSIHEFQYRDTSQIWGESIHPHGINTLKTNEIHTHIGNDVWIGDNAVILRGVKLGTGAIIAAGAVVTHDVPNYAIVAGVPAKVIKYRFSDEIINILMKSMWWQNDIKSLEGLDFNNPIQAINKLNERNKA